jgi:hypothetical protein
VQLKRGLPSFDDKLVQEVVRMILEAIYEKFFEPTSHGFRPRKSYHTALHTFRTHSSVQNGLLKETSKVASIT